MVFLYLSFAMKFVIILVGVAFITLFERKILSFSQNRVGPNKMVYTGILQPLLDGLKLFLKESLSPHKNLQWATVLGPVVGFVVMLSVWCFSPPMFQVKSTFFLLLFVMVFMGVSVYSSLITGWSSTSKFASLGGVRLCSQSVSYEISLLFFIFCSMLFFSSLHNFYAFSFLPLFFLFYLD